MLTKKNRLVTFLAVAAAATGLTSCLKNDTTAPEPVSAIFFLNGASTAFDADLYMNDKKINSSAFAIGTMAPGYFKPATYKFDFKKVNGDSILATTLPAFYDTARLYTVVAFGDESTGVETYKIAEDFSNNSTSKANVRFFNLSPDAEAVDLFIGSNKVASSRTFGDFASGGYDGFVPVDPGSYTLTVKNAAGDVLASNNDAALTTSAGAYFIFYMGRKAETGTRKAAIKWFQYRL
ncbi:DUF4397 domain-containing protein [Chitinophaga lutea]